MENKFIFFKDSEKLEEFMSFAHLNVYIEQDFEKFKRLLIWVAEDAIKYLLQLIGETKGPYSIMYILRKSRCNNEFDEEEKNLINYFNWAKGPLQEIDK